MVNPRIPHQKEERPLTYDRYVWAHAPTINYYDKGSAITLCFQPCSDHYTALQMENSTRNIIPENTDDFCNNAIVSREETIHTTMNWHLVLSEECDGTQR